jgi:small subunit ribosomal protein S16
MSLKIRLTRVGSTHNPIYRVAVAETRSRRDGAAVEQIGNYNPRSKGAQLTLDIARYEYWLQHGAKPSDTVNGLYKRAKRAEAAKAAAPAAS